jgi:HSP20 family protein
LRKRILCAWEIERLQHSLDEVLDLLSVGQRAAPPGWSPAVDLVELESSFVVRVDLPGVDRESVEVKLAGLELTIGGRKKLARPSGSQRHCLHMERGYGSFLVEVTLPGPVSPVDSSAALTAGVLTISLGRIAERRRVLHTIRIGDQTR